MLTERKLIYPNERKYFVVATIFSILSYISLIVSIGGILLILFFLGLSFFAHGLMLANIRTNGVKLSSKQFPIVFEKTKVLCEKMGMITLPDVYVMQSGGILNAFATRFFGRNMVVLYSEFFELINQGAENELEFIIAHELAHIKRRHISKQMLILPAMWIPFLSEAYSRTCEYTCDRFGAYYTGNTEASKNSLMILAIGKDLYPCVNQMEFLEQINQESGFFVWLSEKISTHPPLPKRVREIDLFEKGEFSSSPKSKLWIVLVVLSLIILGGVGYGINYAVQKLDGLDVSEILTEEDSSLITAVVEKNNEQLKTLISLGENLNLEDSDGWTALDWAIEDENKEAVLELVNAGANVNHMDLEKVSPLMRAAIIGNTEIMDILLVKGAKIDEQDVEGYTPLIFAVINQQTGAVELLLDKGANPQIKNKENFTSLMYAIKIGNPEIINLLRIEEGLK